jgi:hypothetical protein
MDSRRLRDLREAYGSIYESEVELTEEQVWEEVESWVSSLLEDGYDLSEYTWEELYEEYLNEMGQTRTTGQKTPEQIRQEAGDRATNQRAQLGVVKTNKGYIAKPGATSYDPDKGAEAIRLATRLNKETGLGRQKPVTPLTKPPAAPILPPPGRTPPTPATRASSSGSIAPRPATSAPPRPAASSPTKPTGPAIGKLGSTSFERRTPTSAELRAAQAVRATQKASGQDTSSVKNAEKALQAAQKTNLPTTGPSPAIPSASSVTASVAKANSPAVINRPAPAGSALAAQQKSKSIMQKQSYEWGSTSKLVEGIADAYSSIYEAKKKIDQDEDNDNDFADVRIARMIASGVPKAKAIAMVKDKSYNEAYVPWDFGPRDKAKAKHTELAARKAAGGSAPGTATRANTIASVGREMRTTLDKNSAATGTNPAKQGLQPATQRHTAAALRGAGGGMTASKAYDVKPLKPASKGPKGGGSSAQGVGSPSGTGRYQVGGGQGYGISGIKLADDFTLWINDLIDEGYDLSEYTWEDMFEIYEETQLDEATRMRKELGKEGETATRKELARRSNAYQRSGSVDRTIAAAERGARNPYVAMGKNETESDYSKRKQQKSKTLTRLASNRRGSVRDKPRAGLRGYAAKVEGDDRDLQSARSSARSAGTLTPAEKKGLGEDFELWVNDLIEEGYDLSDYTWDEMAEIYEETELEKKKAKEAAIAARRARVAQLQSQGRVMTSAKRTSGAAAQRKEEKRAEALERAANAILRQTTGSSGKVSDKPMGSVAPAPKEEAPEANRRLKTGLRRDTLGTAADDALKGVKKEEYEIYEAILDYLLENNFADTQDNADVIIENMSEEWAYEILEGYKKLPVAKMSGQIGRKLKVHDPKYYKPGALTQAKKLVKVMDTHSERKAKVRGEGQALLNKIRGGK